MKKLTLLISIIFLSTFGFSQTMKIPAIYDTLTGEQFHKIINKEFNSVINSSGKTTIGNYASADFKMGNIAFNATKMFKNGHMLSLNINGGITDGFFSIFTQNKVNSNVGLDLKFNIRLKSGSISFHTHEIEKLNRMFRNNKLDSALSETIFNHDSILLQSKMNLIKIEINSIIFNLKENNLSPEQKANFEYLVALKNLQKDSLQFRLQTLPLKSDVKESAKGKKDKANSAAVSRFKYTDILFHWFSVGGGFHKNNFNQFNPKFSALDSQLTEQNFVVWSATVEYNLYKWNQYSKPTFYLLYGAKGSIDDNLSDLSKVEINDTHIYGDSKNQRTSTKKYNAYKGDYKTKLISAKLYLDYYRFILNNSAAIHFYPEVIYKENNKPLYNTGIGLLYSFKDAEDKENKAKLNAELYFKLSDLTNNGKSDLSVWSRNELGLRLSIPVSFFNF